MLDRLRLQDNGIPIYIQLRDQMLAAIGRGAPAPGERLPTMREVAVALKIDLNTVQRAYGELERDGIVTMVQGRGSFVAETPPPAKNARKEAQTLALKVAAQAQAAGIALDDVTAALAALAEKTRKAGGRK
jgi:GntR family transcriptional regulator